MSVLPVRFDKRIKGDVMARPGKLELGVITLRNRVPEGPSWEKTAVVPRHQLEGGLAVPEEPGVAATQSSYLAPRALRVERAGVPSLVVPLYPDRTYTFGRAPESSFVFPADSVSRIHGRLATDADGRWVYRDLNSRNGTWRTKELALEKGTELQDVWRIGPGRERPVQAGWTLILGNGDSRVTLLAEVPEEVARRSRRGALSKASAHLEQRLDICSRHRMNVFLLGASGTGKTYAARVIHERSRMEGNFVVLNCGRLPQDPAQLTSELLGHVKGAFTGAESGRTGKLQSADRGTLFLDEVESLSRAGQDFLLDVLEGSGSYSPYGAQGGSREVPPRFRVISASKKPLLQSGLRPDLCQRLATGEVIVLPTLADRREDIPQLIQCFVEQLQSEQQIRAELTEDAIQFLEQADWPGEVRELESAVKVVISREHAHRQIEGTQPKLIVVGIKAVKVYLAERAAGFGMARDPDAAGQPSRQETRKRPADLSEGDLRRALQEVGGNKTQAAARLGVALNTLKAKLREFGIG